MKVLVPYDGGELSEQAAVLAIELLAQHPLSPVLLRVASDSEHAAGAQESLEEAAARLTRSTAAVTPVLALGRPAQEIVRCADQQGADLIVMSTHGRGALARMLVGSVADRVVRTAAVPVLVIQPHSMEIPFDPVGGEEIDPDKATYTSEYHGRTFHFTSFEHKQRFDSTPEAYTGRRLDRPVGCPSPYEGFAQEGRPAPSLTRDV